MRVFRNYLFCIFALYSSFSRDYSLLFWFDVLRELSRLVEVNLNFKVLFELLADGFIANTFSRA